MSMYKDKEYNTYFIILFNNSMLVFQAGKIHSASATKAI